MSGLSIRDKMTPLGPHTQLLTQGAFVPLELCGVPSYRMMCVHRKFCPSYWFPDIFFHRCDNSSTVYSFPPHRWQPKRPSYKRLEFHKTTQPALSRERAAEISAVLQDRHIILHLLQFRLRVSV